MMTAPKGLNDDGLESLMMTTEGLMIIKRNEAASSLVSERAQIAPAAVRS